MVSDLFVQDVDMAETKTRETVTRLNSCPCGHLREGMTEFSKEQSDQSQH